MEPKKKRKRNGQSYVWPCLQIEQYSKYFTVCKTDRAYVKFQSNYILNTNHYSIKVK